MHSCHRLRGASSARLATQSPSSALGSSSTEYLQRPFHLVCAGGKLFEMRGDFAKIKRAVFLRMRQTDVGIARWNEGAAQPFALPQLCLIVFQSCYLFRVCSDPIV